MRKPHLMVVESYLPLLDAYRAWFEQAGYGVSTYGAASVALEDRAAPQGIDAVITNLNSGAISGIELIRRLRASDPSLAALVVTGAPSEEVAAVFGNEEDIAVVIKGEPFESLQASLERLLDGGGGAQSSVTTGASGRHSPVEAAGIENEKVEPSPGAEATQILPP